jgi:hypothetical protein
VRVEGCADGRAQVLNLQCAGRDVDDLGLPKGTALELKALLESLRAPVPSGEGGGGGGGGASPAPVRVCDAHTKSYTMHVSSSSYGMPPSTSRTYMHVLSIYIICVFVCVYVCMSIYNLCVCFCIYMYLTQAKAESHTLTHTHTHTHTHTQGGCPSPAASSSPSQPPSLSKVIRVCIPVYGDTCTRVHMSSMYMHNNDVGKGFMK